MIVIAKVVDVEGKKEIRCGNCNRFMGEAHGTVVADMKCPNSSCKCMNHVKIISADPDHDRRFKFVEVDKKP